MPQDLWIADIDGVFTNLKAQVNREALDLSAKIGSGVKFAYVSGRSAAWIEDNIIPVLEQSYVKNAPVFSFIGAEYGAVVLRRNGAGSWEKTSGDFPVLNQLRDRAREEIGGFRGVTFDDTKEVMISVEVRHDLASDQDQMIAADLKAAGKILQSYASSSKGLEYHETTYAADLSPAGLNKAYGTRLVLDTVGDRPDFVHLIGDARSDLLLADPLKALGISYLLHFVGDRERLSPPDLAGYELDFPAVNYDLGTIKVLKKVISKE